MGDNPPEGSAGSSGNGSGGSTRSSETLRRLIIEQQVFTAQDRPELSRLFLRHLEWPPALLDKIHERSSATT